MADTTAPLELPIGVTESRVLQQIARIESQLRKSQNQTEQNFLRSNKRAAESFRPIAREARGMSNSTRASLQNVGYQVQDIIVQIQGGQGAVRAFSQQMPQLLSGFGLAGVVAGTLAPLFIGVATALFQTSDSAEQAEEQIKALATAINELEAAQKRAATPGADLFAQFGPMAQQARELYEVQKRIAELNLTREINKTASIISKSQIGISDALPEEWEEAGRIAESYFQKVRDLQESGDLYGARKAKEELGDLVDALGIPLSALRDLRDQFGLSYAEAGKLAAAFQRLSKSEGANIAGAAADLRYQLSEALANIDNANEEAIQFVESLLNLEESALRFAAVDMAGNISAGADQARRIADELARAVTNAENLATAGLSSLRVAQIRNQYVDDPVGAAAALAAERFDSQTQTSGFDAHILAKQRQEYIEAERQAAIINEDTRRRQEAIRKAEAEATKTGGSAGRVRKSREDRPLFESAQQDLIRLEREITLIGKSTAEVARARAQWALLDEAKRRGMPVNETLAAQIDAQAAQVARLTAELEAGEIAQQQFEQAVDGIADAFAGALVAGESLRDGLAQVLRQIASDIMTSGIRNALAGQFNAFGGGSSLLGNMFGGFFGRLPGRAVGGPVMAGQPYMVGERGPEPFVPAVNGRILSVQQAQAALRGGGGQAAPKIVINNNAPGVEVQTEFATKDEVRLMITKGIAGVSRANSDKQYLGAV